MRGPIGKGRQVRKRVCPAGFYMVAGQFFEVPASNTLQYDEGIHGPPQSFPNVAVARAAYQAANPRASQQVLDEIFGQE